VRDVCWFLDVIEIKDMVKGKANCILSEFFSFFFEILSRKIIFFCLETWYGEFCW